MMQNLIKLAENGMMPDALIRLGIRRLCRERLESASKLGVDGVEDHHQKWVEKLLSSPIALVPDKANEQHYEVPPEFFEYVLGKNLKYSSGYWPEGVISLDQSEDSMLEHTFGRLEIEDGMDVLELGCGWGSLTCYMAERLPNSKIVAVSNSKDQREYINTRCKENGFDNV
ncbi:MAG: SAM-dependent methyltransferase, partial [bacterium TMED198]